MIKKNQQQFFNHLVKEYKENRKFYCLVNKELEAEDYRCNAVARAAIAARISPPAPRELSLSRWLPVLQYAEVVGGCKPGEVYQYIDARGDVAEAKVYDLYGIPAELKNAFLVCFSGFMTAHLYNFEAMRVHFKKTGEMLPIFCTGKEGNKGLFKKVFEREGGMVIKTEAEAYLRPLSVLGPEAMMRKYQRAVADTDTHGNFDELYAMAKSQGLSEVTFLLCSGNFAYDKRLLAEGMLQLRDAKYADVKINLGIVHCPMCLGFSVPEGHLSEILLGYVAAALGPLMKGTTPLSLTEEPHPGAERYLLPGTAEADWEKFRELIGYCSNMGWPNYAEILYGMKHEEATAYIIEADLYARASFTPRSYDNGVRADLKKYQEFLGGVYWQKDNLRVYLCETPDARFFK